MAVTLEEARQRFQDSGFQRADRYEMGTSGKGGAWAASKARAKKNFAPAMQEALSKDLYGKGIENASAEDYDKGVRDKGVPNWSTGVQAGADKFGKNIGKFVSLWSASLPTAAGPRRSSNNLKRMTENVQRFIDTAGK